MSRETKSPIKDLPVRLPGESARERYNNTVDEEAEACALIFLVPAVLAVYEWFAYLRNLPRHPWLITIVAVLCAFYALWRFGKAKRLIRQLNLGRIGEEAVGQYLEEKLRPVGCQVLHDILFDNFNIDHVVIGPSGVYSVETKTCSKPVKGAASITYDGQHVRVNGFKPERDPIVQAKANAHSLYELIERTTGKRFGVQPVVLYPGWYVEKMPDNAEVWVLNEKAFPTFIANGKKILPPDDVNLITFHLKRYVIARAQEKQ
jgi:hypothetical protein